jgi:hypothetical protein
MTGLLERTAAPLNGAMTAVGTAPGLTTVMLYNSAGSGHLFRTIPGTRTVRSGQAR